MTVIRPLELVLDQHPRARADVLAQDVRTEGADGLLLHDQKDGIEDELGYPLEWEELPTRRDCRISAYLNDVDPEDEKGWRRQHEWLASRLNDMHRVFADRVRALEPDAWRADGGPDAAVTSTSPLDMGGRR